MAHRRGLVYVIDAAHGHIAAACRWKSQAADHLGRVGGMGPNTEYLF